MFTTEEYSDIAEKLQQIGISDINEQKEVLDFFYQLGKIIYLKKSIEDEEE